MKFVTSKIIYVVPIVYALGGNAVAECEDLKTTKAIVDYVCDYNLVSNIQCRMWREDIRQMHHNTEVIVNSFISWKPELSPEKQTALNY